MWGREKLNILINDPVARAESSLLAAASFTLVTPEISSFLIRFQGRSQGGAGGDQKRRGGRTKGGEE